MKTLLLAVMALALAPFALATEIDVSYSEEFTEALTEDYGLREGEVLTRKISRDLERELAKTGADIARIDVTILKAVPNRPTFEQLGSRPGLDFGRSIGIGGMKLSAIAYDDAGSELGTLEYGWFETDIRLVQGSGTWTDARRASGKFARRFAREFSG